MSFSYNIIEKIFNKTATLVDQEEALKTSLTAYEFALLNISGTNIKRCQEAACKEAAYAYYFAKDIQGADLKYCRKACESDINWLKAFDIIIAKKALV